MLRYIIGISILTAGLMIIRALTNGKILKKHQYAFWIVIPLCMILFPFVKIDIPVLDNIGFLFPSETIVTTSGELPDNSPDTARLEADIIPGGHVIEQTDSKAKKEADRSSRPEQVPVQKAGTTTLKVKEDLNIGSIVKNISFVVSSVLIALLVIYNTGFALYCRRKRRFLRRDPSSGLKIYCIRHRATPFLLFNKIYVEEAEDANEYIICHEACHYKHGDFIWVLVRYIVLFINWYNPFIWAAFILSGRDCELACDEEVLRILGKTSSAGYVETLIGQLKQHSGIPFRFTVSAGMSSGYKLMRKRILNIKRPAGMNRRVLALSLSAIVLFSSCSFINTPKQVKKVSEDDPWFDTTRLEIDISDKGTQIGFEPIYSDDENIYLFCDIHKEPKTKEEYEETGGGSFWGEVIKYSCRDQKILWDKKVDGNSSVFRNKEELVIMTGIYNPDTYQYKKSMFRMDDATGELKEEIKESKILKILNSLPGGSGVAKFIPQESGLAFCVNRNNMDGTLTPVIYLMDEEGNVTTKNLQSECKKLDITNDFSFCKMNENEILVTGDNFNIFNSNGSNFSGFIFNTSDDTYKMVAERSPLILGEAQGEHDWRYCGNGICYSDNYGVNIYDESSDTEMRSLDFNNANIDRYEFLGDMRTLVYTDSRIVMGGMAKYSSDEGKYVIYIFDRLEKNPNVGKTLISVADTREYFTAGLSRAIYEFNNTNSDVYIAMDDRYFLRNYLEEDEKADYEKEINDDYFGTYNKWKRLLSSRMTSKLRMDILSGKSPDIILNASSYSQLDNGDVFVDLSGRLDNLDLDLYRSVLDFFKADDKLYQVPISFTVSGMTEILYDDQGYYYNNPFGDGKTGVTFDEFEEYVRDNSNGKNYFTFHYSRNELFMLLFKQIEKDLIKDGKFDADSDLFRKTADYAMNTSKERSYEAELKDLNDQEELWSYDKELKLSVLDSFGFPGAGVVGIPTADGSIGPMAYSEASAGITCACSNPDAAWEFVSYLLTPSGQKTMINYRYPEFAINQDAMKDIAYEYEKYMMTPDPRAYYFDPMEPDLDPAKMPPAPTEEEIKDKTDQEMKKAEDFIPSLTGSLKGNSDIENVVLEEMGAYFTKDKTLDEVIPIINNRVNLILAETHK